MWARSNIDSVKASLAVAAEKLYWKTGNGLVLMKNLPWRGYWKTNLNWIKILWKNTANGLNVLGAGIAEGLKKMLRGLSSKKTNPSPDLEGQTPEDNRKTEPTLSETDVNSPVENVLSRQIEKVLGDNLPRSMRELNQACQDVEKEFFTLGEELQSLYSDTDLLARTAKEAVHADGGQNPAAKLAEIVDSAQKLLAILGQDHVIIAANIGCIGTVVQRLKRLLDQSVTIKKLGKTLKMIGLNISIESARNLEAHDIFNDLAVQIRGLSETVGVAAVEIQKDTESAQNNLSSLHGEMNQSLNQLKRLGASAEHSMVEAVPEVEKIIALSTDVLSQTRDQSEQISQQVGRIVMDIQLHDSVSQRIEHVGLSLIEAHVTLVSACRKGDDRATESELVDAFAILRLQAAQVERVIHEIREISESTLHAFDQIKVVVETLLASLNSLYSTSGTSSKLVGSEGDHIKNLKSIFFRLNDLIKQGDQEMQRANKATEDSRGTADRLSQHADNIRDLNFDIHLKALNAIASSLRLGSQGRTIEVLVQDMKELAIQSNDYVVQIESVIKEIIAESGSMQTKTDSQDADQSASETEMDKLLTDFSNVSSQFETGIDKAVTIGAGLDQRIELVRSKLLFLNKFAGQIEVSLSELQTVISEIEPFVNEDMMVNEDMHARLNKRYTTHQEREIHVELLCGGSDPFGDNVSAEDASACPDVDLFDDNFDANPTEAGAEEGADDDIGDNVELF